MPTALDRFTFLAFTADGAQSPPATQIVTVKNVNDPTAIAFSSQAGAGAGAGIGTGTAAGALQVYAANGPSSAASPSILTVTGFTLSDPDLGVDPIKAVVTSRGLVTLNPAHTAALDFNSQRYCLAGTSSARWTCQGDGTDDTTMAFLGAPADIAAALNGLTYMSTRPHTSDLINVTLYDGAGGACLDDAQVRGCPAWKCWRSPCRPSHPGTPTTLPVQVRGCPAWKYTYVPPSRHLNPTRTTPPTRRWAPAASASAASPPPCRCP